LKIEIVNEFLWDEFLIKFYLLESPIL
jgi:hypothetical protein